MEDIFLPVMVVGMIFIGLPWVILHYLTKWRTSSTLTKEDEVMLDELRDTARRLEERLITVERIIAAEDPNFQPRVGRHGLTDHDARTSPYHRSN
ncbi:MAG: envelope stress response membrane protein PspB [Sphingobium sp.]|nr:envelope stress response membrane protein PspB [Sphingobium sp.]